MPKVKGLVLGNIDDLILELVQEYVDKGLTVTDMCNVMAERNSYPEENTVRQRLKILMSNNLVVCQSELRNGRSRPVMVFYPYSFSRK